VMIMIMIVLVIVMIIRHVKRVGEPRNSTWMDGGRYGDKG
jgi:hypothetical protein